MSNDGSRFDRLPVDAADRTDPGRATRSGVVGWWRDRFGVPADVFEPFTFWEKGAGKVWILGGTHPTPVRIEALGMRVMHTRQEHWKPTTNAVQRFGDDATRNRIEVGRDEARRFVRGEDQAIPWEGDWGYLIVVGRVADTPAPLGVGLYIDGELRSQVPKGRRREIP